MKIDFDFHRSTLHQHGSRDSKIAYGQSLWSEKNAAAKANLGK